MRSTPEKYFRVWCVLPARDMEHAIAKAKLDDIWVSAELCMQTFMAGTVCTLGKNHPGGHESPDLHSVEE